MTSYEEHQEQFRHWVDNIMYALDLKVSGKWGYIEYQGHMIKIAKEVKIQSHYIQEMQEDLDRYKISLGVV